MFASEQIVRDGNNSYKVKHGDDSGLHVEFYTRSVKQDYESELQGRYIGKDVSFIKILFPGDKTKAVDRPATKEDEERFSKHWDAFSKQQEQVQVGTPIEEWALVSKSEALSLKSINIHTVDQLAAAPDVALNWLGARDLRTKAQAFLEQAKDGSAITKLMAENATLKSDVEMMKTQILELTNKSTKSKKD